MGDEHYPAGVDVPGTPAPFPFGLAAGINGLAALVAGMIALFVAPFATYVYWFVCAEWLVVMLLAISRDRAGPGWLGAIGVLAPLATSAIMGSAALIRIPG